MGVSWSRFAALGPASRRANGFRFGRHGGRILFDRARQSLDLRFGLVKFRTFLWGILCLAERKLIRTYENR